MAVTSRGNTQTKPANAQNYVEYDEYVDYQLEKTRSIVKRTDILTTVTTLAAAVIAYLFVFVVFDQWVVAGGFSYTARVVLLTIMLALVVGTLTRRVLFPLLRRVHPLYAARVIEGSDPQFQSNLVNFVDVKLSNAESVPVVLKSMQKRAAVELSHIDVEEAVDHRPLLRVAYALLAVVVLAAAYILWSPKDPFASVKRALAPTAPIEVATETTIKEVTPDDDSDVPARSVVTIEADVRGKDAEHAQILYTTTDHKYVDQVVEMRQIDPALPRFRGVLNGENGRGLLQSLTYRIVAGDAHTREYSVNVIQPPGARLDEVQYVFPAYMQLEEKKTLGGDIDGYEGAVVTVKATANVPVKRATVILTDTEAAGDKGEEKSMQVTEGTKLSASWKLEFKPDGTSYRYCHIQVETEKKERDPDPTLYSYHVRPDQRPEVALLAPAGDLTMAANGVIPLVIQASDPDFQLRSVTLKIEKGGEAVPDQRLFEDRELGQSLRGSYDFRLTPLQLTAGENIFFWIEVKDNKQPTANRANTPRIKVDIDKPVSAAEAQKQLADEKQKQQAELDKAQAAANPDDASKQPPHDPKDEPQAEDGQQPKDRAETGDGKQPDRKPSQNEKGAQNPADDGPGDAADRKRQPVTEEEMLQRLIQNQRKNEAPRDKTDNQQLPTDDEKAIDRSDAARSDDEKSDRGQGAKAGQKSDKSASKQEQRQGKDQSQAGNAGDDDKTSANDSKRTPDDTKNQQSNKSQTDKDQPDKKQPNADNKSGNNKRQPPSADEKNQEGDQGPPSDKKDGGPGKKSDGDKPGDSAKGADEKPKSKPQADDKKNPSGKESGDKSNDAKKSGDGSRKDEDGKNKTGNDDSGNDKDGSDDAGKNDKRKDDAGQEKPGKDGAGKDKGGNDDANQSDKSNNDKGDDKPGKNPAGKDDATKEGSEKGDSDQGDTGKPDDGKNDRGKKDMKNDADSPQDKAGSDDNPATDQKKQAQGGAGQKEAADSDPASNSNDQSKDKGSPGKSDKPEGDQQPGDGKGEKSQKKKGDGTAKTSDNDNPSGKEEPADDDPNAKKKKATGDETGEGTGSDEPDPDATKSNNDLKKKDGSQPGAKQPADDASSNGKKSDQKRQPQEGTKKGAADADKADRAPDGKGPTEKTDELDEPPSDRSDKKPGGESEKRPGQPPDAGNRDLKGNGRKPGQKSDQPETGETGGSAATDQGKKGANKPGAGDKGTDGNTDPTQEKTGQPGDKQKGPGSTTKPSDDGEGQKKDGPGGEAGDKNSQPGSKKGGQGKKSGDQGQPGEGGDKSGDNKGQPGGKQAGQKSGKGDAASGDPGSKPGDAKGQSNGKSGKPGQPGASQQQTGNGISAPPADGDPGKGPGPADGANATKPPPRSSDEPSTAEEEQANLEAARKATNLVLQRLKSQLERGEVDQEMMDELGWKDKKDVEKFVKYLEKGMAQKEDDNSPESEARRMQFEETLRGMNLGNETQRRTGSVGKERAIEQIGAKNAPVPREYQKVWESYTRSLSKQTEKSDAKAKGQDKVKAVKTR